MAMKLSQERSKSGFTLVEMIVTIGIIIMVAGFIAPAVSAIFQDRRIENAASVIVTAFNEARNSAVTKKQEHSVVFLKSGIRLYAHPKGKKEGGFIGGLRSLNVGDSDHITYEVLSSDTSVEEMPVELQSQREEKRTEHWKPGREDIVIKLRKDGTIDFGKLDDIPSYRFQSDPPTGGDLILHQKGSRAACYIDIRPTGRVVSKVGEEGS
ncbi:MAG: prepilin-type N-terminal cleavage/methylation domain-containing protein [Planctomycetota bacterium]|nr:prepilin-type N-terminal cleavage/methylation domain-containing protein [Planctomycetota bacterium]